MLAVRSALDRKDSVGENRSSVVRYFMFAARYLSSFYKILLRALSDGDDSF